MFYRKNLYTWEQGLRMAVGIGLALVAALAMPPGLLAYLLVATGVVLALTGLVGWCPACAAVGRRIDGA